MLSRALQCLVHKCVPASARPPVVPVVWKAICYAGWGKPRGSKAYHYFDNNVQCLCAAYHWFDAAAPGALIHDAQFVNGRCEYCLQAHRIRYPHG